MKSLSVILVDEPLSSLRELAGWWGAEPLATDTAEARQKLERAMRDTIAARFVWEHLNEDERRVLFAVAGPSARNWCLVDSIADRGASMRVRRGRFSTVWSRNISSFSKWRRCRALN